MQMLLEKLQTQLSAGLLRKASSLRCSDWSQNYIQLGMPIPGRLSFKYHPWSKEWHDYPKNWVGKKAAQMAMSQAAIDRAIFVIDILKTSVMYILPKKNPDATDFVNSKFNPLLDQSEYLKNLFSDVRNVGHKAAGGVSLYIRGARSKSALKGISTGLQIWDEFDEMPRAMHILGAERGSGFFEEDRQVIKFSTPTIPGFGIAEEIKNTTKEHWVFKCPGCSRYIELRFPESLVITSDNLSDEASLRKSYYKCTECGKRLDQEAKPEFLGLDNAHWENVLGIKSYTRGFEIPQLYSMTVEPWELAKMFLMAKTDPVIEQEFFNSKLGMEHEVEGASIQLEQILQCISGYKKSEIPPFPSFITMGIDVGKVLHVHVDQWMLPRNLGRDLNMFAKPKVRWEGFVADFEDAAKMMYDFQIIHCIIDHEPETRKAYEFAQRFPNRVHLAYNHRGMKGKQLVVNKNSETIGFHRTSWLDLTLSRYKNKTIQLPSDVSEDFKNHTMNLYRLEEKDPDGNTKAKYITRGGQDHAAFARLFSELALVMGVSQQENSDISAFL